MTTPSNFEDIVNLIVLDWKGHDDDFYTDSAKRTIGWYIAKAKTFVEYSAEIRTTERGNVFEEVCRRAGVKPRRMYEDIEVYHRFACRSDSVHEITERIYEECGNWSKALPAKKEEPADVEPSKCGHCPIHCNHETDSYQT